MLTRPPINPGTPQGAAVEPRRSVTNNKLLLLQTLTSVGAVIDVASLGSGYTSADLAHWIGANLVRWAEQDRAAMAKRLARTDVAAD